MSQHGLLDSNTLKFIENFIKSHYMSLIEVETFILHLTILQVLTEGKAFQYGQYVGYTLITLLGVLIHCFKPDLALALAHHNYYANLIGQFLHVKEVKPFPSAHNRPVVEEILMVIIARDCNQGVELYIPKEDVEKWNNLINSAFFDFALHSGDAIKHLNNIVEVLSLANDIR